MLCTYEPVQKFVRRADYAFYQALVEVLIPDVLRPIPSELHSQSVSSMVLTDPFPVSCTVSLSVVLFSKTHPQ